MELKMLKIHTEIMLYPKDNYQTNLHVLLIIGYAESNIILIFDIKEHE